ncbi:Hypp6619 [Branchiostoma lanceolatum]|uniref:Hypp6619 protein n=1 Tax=Branchiostoma lanceolatum TaxID=7740 RepID=A0A8J9YV96_BRALA|nr:Hypp6619 [Branchiostoma lanceolatum]
MSQQTFPPEKLLLTYINLLTPEGKVEAHYLCNTQVTTCDAASIKTTFKEQLASNNIDLNSVTGMCTDGAAVMVGRTSGVGARLKEENPIITGTHCAPHKLNLAAQQAAKNFPFLQRYQRLVGNIYGYFSNSASQAKGDDRHPGDGLCQAQDHPRGQMAEL